MKTELELTCNMEMRPVRACPAWRCPHQVVTYEIDPVIGDDGVGHPEPVDDVQEELDGVLGVDRGYRFCLYPFCELVDCDK